MVIKREKLKGEIAPEYGDSPARYVELETKRLNNGIGYIRFSEFNPALMPKICAALRSMSDASGIIMDLRGNYGGLTGMTEGIAGLLFTEHTQFGSMERGESIIENLEVFPQKSPYTGPVVVLIDNTSISASEVFAASMQETGRAVIVGEPSAGAVKVARSTLPTEAMFIYAIADYVTPKAAILEGQGVMPDVKVKLKRESLLEGHDTQLEAAIEQINRQRAATKQPAIVAKPERILKPSPAKPEPFSSQVNQILDRYVQAMGGKQTNEKLFIRVMKGKIESVDSGESGLVEIYKTPSKFVEIGNLPHMGGTRQIGFNGTLGWEMNPISGYREISDSDIADMKIDEGLHFPLSFRQMYSKITYTGTQDVNGRKVYVLSATSADPNGGEIEIYFDVQTGLLLRKDNTYFEDYRMVDGVMLPFLIRDPSVTYKFEEIKHNIQTNDAVFNPPLKLLHAPEMKGYEIYRAI